MPDKIDPEEIKKLEDFARVCSDVRTKCYLGTHTLTPTNYAEEEEKFYSSSTYNPQYTYNQKNFDGLDAQIMHLRQSLADIDIPQDFRLYLEHHLNDTQNCLQAVTSIGTQEFADHAARIFSLNSPKIQKYLNKSPEIDITEEGRDHMYSAEEIAEVFRQVMRDKYNITDYKVHVDHFNDHTVRVGSNKVILGEKIKRYRKSIDRLIIHEIESHVLQRKNAEKSRILQLTPLADRTLYGEGLAVYNEVTNNKITLKIYRLYSLRLKAVRILDKTFRQIYNELTGGIPDHIAYKITYRVKRGLSDTSLPGGYPKDAFYLLGYMAVEDYVKNGGNVSDLYAIRTPELATFINKYNLVDSKDILLPHFLAD